MSPKIIPVGKNPGNRSIEVSGTPTIGHYASHPVEKKAGSFLTCPYCNTLTPFPKAQSTSQWISVNERLPERGSGFFPSDSDEVLVANVDTGQVWADTYDHNRGDWADNCEIKRTHWMPKPEPPTK